MLIGSKASFAQQMGGMKMNSTEQMSNNYKATNYYTCVMHPEIHASKPGKCPKCGMALYKKTVKAPMQQKQQVKKGTMQMPVKETMQMHNMEQMQMTDSTKHNHEMSNMDMDMPMMKTKPAKQIIKSEPPKTVRYDLYVRDTVVNFTGKPKHAIAVNGQIPMPTLTFTEGDTAEIYVHNELDEPTGLHWHGLFLPNKMDGVPYITQMPIKPHTTYLYKFPIIQNGTHWYHSHFGLQEQIGMYGSMILNKRSDDSTFRAGIDDLPTIPVVLSDWIDMNPKEANRSLHEATDWFAIKKGTTQTYSEAIKSGNLKTKLTNEWKRMNAMDVSDIAYDRFFMNGKSENQDAQFKAGDKVRLRISNGGASSYFWLTWSGGKITVVANDGNDVEPVDVDRLIIGVSETYDVVVTIPENKSYEFLATPEDRTKYASLWLGNGDKVPATKLPKLKYFEGMKMMNGMMKMNGDLDPSSMGDMQMGNQSMDMNVVMYPEITGPEETKNNKSNSDGDMKGMDMGSMKNNNEGDMKGMDMGSMKTNKTKADEGMKGMDMNSMQNMDMSGSGGDIVTLNYAMLRAPHKTTLPSGPLKELNFVLTGNMNRYVWSIDNKVLSEADKILIHKGENVRIVLYNNSMMRHPMHLHGHDFRVLNGQGDYAPLKNVLDIMPMERDTIEFAANTSGDWFFHCHILYHMMSGMGRVFSYSNVDSASAPDIADKKLAQRKLYKEGNMLNAMGRLGIQNNGSDGFFTLSNTRWQVNTLWNLGVRAELSRESETTIGRYFGKMQWLYAYAGFDYHYKPLGGLKNIFGSDAKNWFGQNSNKDNRQTATVGIAYTLPTLTIADFRVDADGKFRFQLGRDDIPVTPRLRFAWMINTDKEYMAGFRYIATKYISLSTHYDSDMGMGAGLTFVY